MHLINLNLHVNHHTARIVVKNCAVFLKKVHFGLDSLKEMFYILYVCV
jgi:hypothetical protein